MPHEFILVHVTLIFIISPTPESTLCEKIPLLGKFIMASFVELYKLVELYNIFDKKHGEIPYIYASLNFQKIYFYMTESLTFQAKYSYFVIFSFTLYFYFFSRYFIFIFLTVDNTPFISINLFS